MHHGVKWVDGGHHQQIDGLSLLFSHSHNASEQLAFIIRKKLVFGQIIFAGARGNGGRVAIGGGAPVTPGGPGIAASSVTRALPAPLIVLLILLGLGAAGGAAVAVRTRVLSRRQA